MPFDVQAIVVAMCRDMHIRGFRYAEFQAEPVIISPTIPLCCHVGWQMVGTHRPCRIIVGW